MNLTPADPPANAPLPIEREPSRVRPPYDTREDRFDHLHATDTQTWRRAVQLDRTAALSEPLAGLVITDYEHRHVEWLARSDTSTVAVFVALLHRARAAAPLDQKPRGAQ